MRDFLFQHYFGYKIRNLNNVSKLNEEQINLFQVLTFGKKFRYLNIAVSSVIVKAGNSLQDMKAHIMKIVYLHEKKRHLMRINTMN